MSIFQRKSIETLLAEMKGDNRLHRVLGPVQLSALGVGAIIGAGIFVMTGRAAAVDAGPAIVLSYAVAALGCVVAALCYAEFAAMAPVAGSAYTYAYTTLGEVFAWIIGWDLILEYSMACATVASAWSNYLNAFLTSINVPEVPGFLCSDPFTPVVGESLNPWFNLPAAIIMALVTIVLVRGIRESAVTNAILVLVKLAVVLFVIAVGWGYVNSANWTSIPVALRITPEERAIPGLAGEYAEKTERLEGEAAVDRAEQLGKQTRATYKIEHIEAESARLEAEGEVTSAEAVALRKRVADVFGKDLPATDEHKAAVEALLVDVRAKAPAEVTKKWGLLGMMGIDRWLVPIDDAARTPFTPYGISGIMLGSAIVFFAFIGFDSISTHAEEARRPQRDVPIGILSSLAICTVLYVLVAAVITGMVPYPEIDQKAAIATAFIQAQSEPGAKPAFNWSAALIALGGLAGMTSVLLVTFLSQVRIFMAMSRDGLLPKIFGEVHPRYKTPHLATMLTGGVIVLTAAFTPISKLEEMVNIGTLMAFVVVCAAVWLLRIRRPEVERPFRCPMLWLVAPLGIGVNLIMMLFLPPDTWLRLVIWLGAGLLIYFLYGRTHSVLSNRPRAER